MSTSPCCSNYKFPATSPGGVQSERFNFGNALAKPQKEAEDYFAMKLPSSCLLLQRPTFVSPRKPASKRNNASGSVSLLASDATYTENLLFISHDFNLSTDTLFEASEVEDSASVPAETGLTVPVAVSPAQLLKTQRNVLQLSLNMPKRGTHHKSRSSLGSSSGLLAKQALARDSTLLEDVAATSAVEPQFHFDRKYSLDVAEDTFSMVEKEGQPITPVPTLRKQLTLPILPPTLDGSFLDAIKSQQMKRSLFVPPQENFRDAIVKLSPTITYLKPAEIVGVLRQSIVQPETRLRNVLVLDIRPLADHVKSQIAGSINICLPLTLLKRASFDFRRCVNSLPAYEKVILQNYFYHNNLNFEKQLTCSNPHTGTHGFPAIVLYDHSNTSSNIYHMCRKLIDHSCFDASSAPPIYLIDAPFQALADEFPDMLVSGKVEDVDVSKLSILDPLEETKTLVSAKAAFSATAPCSIKTLNASSPALSTPNVSNFSLPANLPETKFKIRHNEEVFNVSAAPCSDDKLSNLSVSSPGLKLLPQWLKNSVANNTQIRADFNRLEECEKSRLNSALKIRLEHEFMTPGGHREATPIINSGLDYGHKNRYKDIFLYEHSRVSLNDLSKRGDGDVETKQLGCDYINASYLRSSKSVLEKILGSTAPNPELLKYSNYVATQGPLMRTAGDFWKCVAYQRSLVIISLTNEYENGVQKCFPFWNPGTFMSGDNVVDVSLVDTEEFGAIKLRTFSINIDNVIHHKVMQLHLDSWVDMGVAVNSDDVLAMIHLKNYILSRSLSLPDYPTVIHCSAGCGRTGVFAATDMLMNAFRFNGGNYEISSDPVYDLVNDLRRQRILMVQTIRQYGSIYSLLIHGIVGRKKWQMISDTDITKAFLSM